MKKLITAVAVFLLALVGGGGGYLATQNLGGSHITGKHVVVGSSSNLESVPQSAVFANSTTTDNGFLEDGGTVIQQYVNTDGIDTVLLNIRAIGGTATSTLYVRQMGSHDGSNYFNPVTSTVETLSFIDPSSGFRTPTSTEIFDSAVGFQFVPGVVTTTGISVPMQTTGYKYTRFIVYGDDLSTDPDDGIQAWIEAIIVDSSN